MVVAVNAVSGALVGYDVSLEVPGGGGGRGVLVGRPDGCSCGCWCACGCWCSCVCARVGVCACVLVCMRVGVYARVCIIRMVSALLSASQIDCRFRHEEAPSVAGPCAQGAVVGACRHTPDGVDCNSSQSRHIHTVFTCLCGNFCGNTYTQMQNFFDRQPCTLTGAHEAEATAAHACFEGRQERCGPVSKRDVSGKRLA